MGKWHRAEPKPLNAIGGTPKLLWWRMACDLQAELDRLFPGEHLVPVTGVRLQAQKNQTVHLKDIPRDIRISNSVAVEHNTPDGGAIGHIVRNCRVAADPAVAMDRWFHHDQVGSVLSKFHKNDQLVEMHYQDAFSVRLADWETPLPDELRGAL